MRLAEPHASMSYRTLGHELSNESTVQSTPRKRKRKFANVNAFALVNSRGTSWGGGGGEDEAEEKMGKCLHLWNPLALMHRSSPSQQSSVSYSVLGCLVLFGFYCIF